MKLTINEIADIAQVAKSTVSKALNGQKGVSEEKRKRILELAQELNYEPSASAQALAFNRTGSIGLLIPHEAAHALSGSYWSAIITAVAQEANSHNYNLLILTPQKEGNVSDPVETVLRRRNVDGLIIGAEQIDPAVTSRLIEEEIPFVFIGRNPQVQHYSVDVDNLGASERLVAWLIGEGYTRIGCLAGPEQFLYTQERVAGYRQALKKAGLAGEMIEYATYDRAGASCGLSALMEKYPDMDALYVTAGGDFLLDTIDAIRLSGLNLNRFKLGVFDDYRFFDYMNLSVCTIRQPLAELGATAAGILFRFLSGQEPAQMNYVLDVELILR
jgi:LacI family transcriptional regulator